MVARSFVSRLWCCGIVAVGLASCGGGNDFNPCYSLKVAGGNQCERAPASVAVVLADGKLCTGTFITTRHVLTAAHCMPRQGEEVAINTFGYSRLATRFFIHPDYKSGELSAYDVAIVELDIDADVTPAPLVGSQDVRRGDKLIAFGFGVDEFGNSIIDRVRNGEAPLKATYLDSVSVSDDFVRTVSDGGGDTCSGDSGGPVLFEPDGGDEYGLVAVTSFGPNICVTDSGLPSANTNLQSTSVREFLQQYAPKVRFN